jgi:hypothetical protein
MKVSYRVFWLPKAGLSAEEYEDAFAPETAPEAELSEFRCAVSDGATETSFSGLWAKILCKAYNDKNFDIEKLQAEWLKAVSGQNLPWYAEQKLESGAYAAIVGLCLRKEKNGLSWSARALGDSCLFHLRDGKILKVLPIEKWEAFDYTPALISTKQSANLGLLLQQDHEVGTCNDGDLFYLMTDAISKWFLRRNAEDEDAVNVLESIQNADDFCRLVNDERQVRDNEGRHKMPNDDVTWTRVAVNL